MPPLVDPQRPLPRLLPPPERSTFLFGPRGTGKSTWARQCFPNATTIDLRTGALARTLAANPDRLHDALDGQPSTEWVVIDEIARVPALLDVIHQRMDREPARQFLLTGSSARMLTRAGVNLLGGRAGLRTMPPFLAAEVGDAFSLERAEQFGMLPLIWTATDPEQALEDYVNVAVIEEVRAEARIRRVAGFARALEQLALAHGSELSPTAIAHHAEVAKTTVVDWLDVLDSMGLIARVETFTARPSRRALAARPKLYFFDTGIARALRHPAAARTAPDAIGATREGLVYQHLAAWCGAQRGARLWTWRTTGGTEVDFVVETPDALIAIEVKHGTTLRPADRRGLLAFRDEFPDAVLLALTGASLPGRDGPIRVEPLSDFLRRLRPAAALIS